MFNYIYELKNRFLYFLISLLASIIISSLYKNSILLWISIPIIKLNNNQNFYFIYTNLTEVFWTYFYIVVFVNCFLIIPFFLLQTWFFFKPGMYKKENVYIKVLIVLSSFIWIIITYSLYCYLIPYSWLFFYQINENNDFGLLNIQLEAKLNEYINFIFQIYTHTIVVTQIWITAFYFFIFLRKNTLKKLAFTRKFIYIIVIIFSSLITPPDVISQLSVSLIIIILYEIILLIFLIINK